MNDVTRRRFGTCIACFTMSVACSDPERVERAGHDEGWGEESGDADDGPMFTVEVDAAIIMDVSFGYQNYLELLTIDPEHSETHADAASVRVWGTSGIAERFHSVDPDDPSQAVTFPERTHLVKEHLDATGQPSGLTVMYKAPPGYNPAAGDWFWARVVGQTVTHQGRVDFCMDCHAAAINSDFVVGFGKSE